MKLEPSSHKLGSRRVREDGMIRINHGLELFLIFYFHVIFNVPEYDLHDAVGVINLFRGEVREDAVD